MEEQNTNVAEAIPKTFDDMLKDNNYQSEFDKRVNKALETAKAKWNADAEAKKTEAEKLAKMDVEQKLKYEKEQSDIRAREYEAKLNAYELKEQAEKIALEKGLDISLLSDIDYKNHTAETISVIIDTKKQIFDKALEKALNEKLKEDTPKQYDNSNNTKARISRSSY